MKELLFKESFVKHSATEYDDKTLLSTSSYFTNSNDNLFSSAHPHPEFNFKKNYDSEDKFVENLTNSLYSVHRQNLMLIIERIDNKISLKVFESYTFREVGKKYFKKVKNLRYLTINLKEGNIYFGTLSNYQKKRKYTKTIRKNTFYYNNFANFQLYIRQNLQGYFRTAKNSHIVDETLHSVFKTFFQYIDNNEPVSLSYSERLYRYYLNEKGIKYPNNFNVYLNSSEKLPTLKELRKNEMKLVDSFMKLHSLTGKKLKKVLHTCNSLNIRMYRIAINLFGSDWILQNDEVLTNCLNYNNASFYSTNLKDLKDSFSSEELKKVFEIFKLTLSETINFYTFFDHINTYKQLKSYGENEIRWKANNIDIFRNEHLDWADKLNHYIRGTYYRIYPKHIIDKLSVSFNVDNITYYPVLLDNSYNYNEESLIQSNCVKNYIGSVSSVIVSLRKDKLDSEQRATIEYYIKKVDNKVMVFNVQCLGRFNSTLQPEWLKPVTLLDSLMKDLIEKHNFEPFYLRKLCSNGVELNTESVWVDEKLSWNLELY